MGCECVSVRTGDLRERMRDRAHRSWCDEKLHDPSATRRASSRRKTPRQRITVAQTDTHLVKADGTVPRVDLDNSQHARFKRLIRGSCTRAC